MNFLLDTHTLLWSFIAPASLSKPAKTIITDEENVILVSAASAWEIATKVRKGKLPEAEALEGRFLEALDEVGFSLLSIDAETALRAARLTTPHSDPYDRIIAAHALALDIPLISLDAKLDQFGVRRIW